MTVDPSLQSAIDALSFPGIVIGHRLISPGDEDALLPEEAAAFASSVVKVRRASGSARIVASNWGSPNARYRELPGERQPGLQESSARSPTILVLRLQQSHWVVMWARWG